MRLKTHINASMAGHFISLQLGRITLNERPVKAASWRRKRLLKREGIAMTGLVRTSADLDDRRRRILYRCWHRGIREMDLVLGQFAEENISFLTSEQLDELELIMAEEDQDLVRMVTGADPVPERLQSPLFSKVMTYRPDFDPVKMNDARLIAE